MSASQEKKKRREEDAAVKEKKKRDKHLSTAAKRKIAKTVKTVVAVVVIVCVLALVVLQSTMFTTVVAAVKVGNHKYSADEFNFYYKGIYSSTYQSISTNYGQYASYILDATKPLDEQDCYLQENTTWDEYFEQQALDTMQHNAILCDEANAEGFTLSDEAQQSISTTLSDAKTAATKAGYDSFKKYLTETYGKGFTEDMFKNMLTEQTLASYYAKEISSRFESTYTDDQLMQKYDSESEKYNLITYCYYYVDGSADDDAGIDADTAMKSASNVADTIAAAKTEDVFADLVYQNCPDDEKDTYKDASSVLKKNVAPSKISESYSDWLTSSDRAYGDTYIYEGDTGYTVLLFVSSNHNDFKMRNFRHILIQAEKDEDTEEVTTDTINAAKTQADSVYDEWKQDATEDNFAALANKYSSDTGSNTNGGLYEDVTLGTLVSPIEDWVFDDSRQAGDNDIVYVSNDNYTGYHILYYVGEGEQYNLYLAKQDQLSEDYQNWLDERSGNYTVSKTFTFRFAK